MSRTRSFSSERDALAADRAIAAWLFVCCAWLFALVLVGGITRLTHSGLSITEWQPLVGTLPPLSAADWHELFTKYQQTPEFRLINSNMDLAGFQGIFWWEWTHRFLARGLGSIYAVPFFYFLLRRRLNARWARRFAIFLLIGGAQGVWGWLMVKSGLEEKPWVSPVRLAGHLGLAFGLYVAMLASALHFSQRMPPVKWTQPHPLQRPMFWLGVLVFVQTLSGALVAGLRAGLIYNTFPTMNGQWIPVDMWTHSPWWLNFIDNGTTVQFFHRLLAGAVTVAVLAMAWRLWQRAHTAAQRHGALLLAAALMIQVILGISTLLLRVPVALGAAHQGGALVLLTAITWLWWCLSAHGCEQTVHESR